MRRECLVQLPPSPTSRPVGSSGNVVGLLWHLLTMKIHPHGKPTLVWIFKILPQVGAGMNFIQVVYFFCFLPCALCHLRPRSGNGNVTIFIPRVQHAQGIGRMMYEGFPLTFLIWILLSQVSLCLYLTDMVTQGRNSSSARLHEFLSSRFTFPNPYLCTP